MRFIFILIFSLLTTTVFASTDFQTKVDQITAGKITIQELNSWKNELLFPHLQGIWLKNNIQNVQTKDIANFKAHNENKAAYWFLKPIWHNELVRREDWTQVKNEFRNSDKPDQICFYFQALSELNEKIPTEKLEKLWMSGQSRPNHCDPFFESWIASLKDPDPLLLRRQIKAFYQRNGKLVSYLIRYYKNEENKILGRFLSTVYHDPKSIISKNYDPNSSIQREIALAAVNRMAYKDPKSASNLWLRLLKVTPDFSQAEIYKASQYLGVAMAKQAIPEASYWLAIADPKKEEKAIQHWRLQIALADENFAAVVDLYRQISPKLQALDQWKYWYGYSLLKIGNLQEPNNPLSKLSRQRSYYGYLAATELGAPFSLNSSNNYPTANPKKLTLVPELKRSKALYLLGFAKMAQVEWNLWVRYQDNQTQHDAAELALSWGWYAKASQSAGWSGRYNLIHLRYPDAFGPFVEHQAEQLDVPFFWLYGVMRQESRFEHTAVSPAGALGLMQVMPATAKLTAKKHKLKYNGTQELTEPSINIAIGSHYLDDLLNQFGNPILATAAYNAGPSRVRLWEKRFPSDLRIWIESIPFDETRNYVKSVLAYSQIYALSNNQNWRLASWLNQPEVLAQK